MTKILVIDDKQDNLIAITAMLRQRIPGCALLTAASGEEGLRIAAREKPDTILLDLKMPVMDGFETCRRLRAEEATRDIPVIVLTAVYKDPESSVRALDQGADVFLSKPVDESELAAQVRAMLRIRKAEASLRRRKELLEEMVRQRTAQLASEREALRREVEIKSVLADFSRDLMGQTKGLEELAEELLQAALGLTDSRDGFVASLDPSTGFGRIYALAGNRAWSERAGRSGKRMMDEMIRLAGAAGGAGKSFFCNSPGRELDLSRLPKSGHIPIERFLHVPVLLGEEIIGAVALANSSRDYDAGDLEIAESLTSLFSLAVQSKRYEVRLSQSERNYRAVFESSADALTITDLEGRVLEANPAACRVLGRSRDELLRLKVEDFLSLESAVVRQARIRELEEGATVRYEPTNLRADGTTVSMEATLARISFRDQPAVLSISRDITERKRAEALRVESEHRLFQSQRLESVGQLAGGVAHDFNNMLTAIRGYLELSVHKLDIGDPVQDHLKQAMAASSRAADIAGQLLLFSRKAVMEYKPCDLNQTIDGLRKMLSRLIGEDIEVKLELDPAVWTVDADAGRIEQALMNLFINARDAMPDGGTIVVGTRNTEIDSGYVARYPIARTGRFVVLEVSDTGSGIDPGIMEHIFEPFFTTKPAGMGTGLGLSVVYGIVKEHGGWINVHSEAGNGARFEICLPVSRIFTMGEEAGSPGAVLAPERQGGGRTVLVVEDDQAVRELLVTGLTAYGYRVIGAGSGREAKELFGEQDHGVDLVLSDVILPDCKGMALVEELLATRPEQPVILMSGYLDKKVDWTTIQEQGYKLVRKPFILSELLEVIEQTLSREKEDRTEE